MERRRRAEPVVVAPPTSASFLSSVAADDRSRWTVAICLLPWRRRCVPGRYITDHQMRLFMKFRQNDDVAIAATKAGFSSATGYRIAQDPRPPSQSGNPEAVAGPTLLLISSSARSCLCCGQRRARDRSRSSRRCAGDTPISARASVVPWSGVSAPGQPFMAVNRMSSSGQLHEPGRMGLSNFTEIADLCVRISASRWTTGSITSGLHDLASSMRILSWAAIAMWRSRQACRMRSGL